jgi:hypothetical protein
MAGTVEISAWEGVVESLFVVEEVVGMSGFFPPIGRKESRIRTTWG